MSMISCPMPRVHPFPSVFNQQKKKKSWEKSVKKSKLASKVFAQAN